MRAMQAKGFHGSFASENVVPLNGKEALLDEDLYWPREPLLADHWPIQTCNLDFFEFEKSAHSQWFRESSCKPVAMIDYGKKANSINRN